jgi:hypothetical protein
LLVHSWFLAHESTLLGKGKALHSVEWFMSLKKKLLIQAFLLTDFLVGS